jgi:hypothetical protein
LIKYETNIACSPELNANNSEHFQKWLNQQFWTRAEFIACAQRNKHYYDTMVTFQKLEITKDATTVTLDDVKKAYRTVHASIHQNNTRDRKHEDALFTRAGPGKHYPKFFIGDCRKCGQKGHKSANCREKPSNKDKRLPNWKIKNSREATHLTTSNNSYHCDYCNKDGHTEDRFYKKKRDEFLCFYRSSFMCI